MENKEIFEKFINKKLDELLKEVSNFEYVFTNGYICLSDKTTSYIRRRFLPLKVNVVNVYKKDFLEKENPLENIAIYFKGNFYSTYKI